jgi:HEPN domain-containing protein
MPLLAPWAWEGVDEFLAEAEEAYHRGLYAAAVLVSHAAAHRGLSHRLRDDRSSLKELASKAYRDGVDVAADDLGRLAWLRNRVSHEGYMPSRKEAKFALGTARSALDALEKRSLFSRAVNWVKRQSS